MKIAGFVLATSSPYLKLGISRYGLASLMTKARNEGHQAVMVDGNVSKINLN